MELNLVMEPSLPPVESFVDMELSDDVVAEVINNLEATATPLQQLLLPALLKGGDVLACAPSSVLDAGCKASFLIAAMNIMATKGGGYGGGHGEAATPMAVILVPTRSLVQDCVEIARSFVPFFGIENGQFKCVEVFGGVPVAAQLADLQKGCDLLIATPGRLIDLVERDVINFNNTKFLVLDELDRMIDMGFEPQLRSILNLPDSETRQKLFVSCSDEAKVQSLADDTLNSSNKYHIHVASDATQFSSIYHEVKFVENDNKVDALLRVVGEHPGQLVLVFAATKRNAEHINDGIKAAAADGAGDVTSDCIHGDKMQSQREETLQNASSGQLNVLIVTDVAARGISLPSVDVVVLYDLPAKAHFEERLMQATRISNGNAELQIVSFFNSNNLDVVDDLIDTLERQTDSFETADSLARLSELRGSL